MSGGNEHPRGLAGCSGWTARRTGKSGGYRRGKPPRRPKLGSVHPIGFLEERGALGPATAIQTAPGEAHLDRLRDEYGFTGGYTVVKDYVA